MTLDNTPIVKIVVPSTNIPESVNICDTDNYPTILRLVPFPGTGLPGAQGITGSQGLIGSQGIAGQQGFRGIQGLTGLQGSTGSNGLDGSQGISGSQGLSGLQGIEGSIGSQGITGVQGSIGIQGNTGVQGETGSQGSTGIQGIAGPQGSIGQTGIQGSIGQNGQNGLQGISGQNGAQGSTGLQGQIGLQGLSGSQGAQGVQGTIGSQGLAGQNGIQGIQGLIGQGVAPGGTEGQLLAKIDSTDYNTIWIDNYTSQLKHLVKNASGSTINIGTPVYVKTNGTSSTNIEVNIASNTSEATSSKTLGLIAATTLNNGFEYVITEGLLAGINTSTANNGDAVWLGVNGALIFGLANKPVAPAHLVFIGVVTRGQQNNGEIFVKVQNGFEVEEIHNLVLTNVQNNDAIVYDSVNGRWKNSQISGSGGSGTQGVQGTQGLEGSQGTIGLQGIAGSQGVQGLLGTQGSTGANGLQGTSGSQGLQGIQGTQGLQGTQGNLGTQGTIGLGLLSGGTTNQVLAKIDGTNYNVYWMDSQALGTTSSPTFNNLTVNGIFYPQQINEAFQTYSTSITSGSTVALDCSAGNIWNITSSVAGNWTANLTNTAVTSGFATNVTLIINQGATGYIPNALQIGGVSQTINWQGGTAPTPNANKKDAIAFSILNSSGTYTVFGQLVTFG